MRQRRFEVGNVALQFRLANVLDRSGYDRTTYSTSVAQHASIVFTIEFWKRLTITTADYSRHRILALFLCERPPFDSTQTLMNIECPRDGFAILTITYDVDASFELESHCFVDRLGEASLKLGSAERLIIASFLEKFNE